jgi:hypothetical protein
MTSTCAKCGKTAFEVRVAEPAYSKYKVYFVQCSSCGSVFGVLPYFDLDDTITSVEKKVGAVHRDVGNLKEDLSAVKRAVEKMERSSR